MVTGDGELQEGQTWEALMALAHYRLTEVVVVLELIALGHTNAEIADRLFLSIRTVESHRANIQSKLDLGSRAELVRYALDHGIIGS